MHDGISITIRQSIVLRCISELGGIYGWRLVIVRRWSGGGLGEMEGSLRKGPGQTYGVGLVLYFCV